MARRPRREEAGAVHHVFARHNEQRLLFRDDADRRRYLAGLALVVGRFSWQCMSYCLMPNHLHLLVATPMANLGRGMQRLHGDYGRWFADRRRKPGHVFQGRYGAVRVESDEQLWTVARYIALNPVVAGLADDPEAWTWGSHAAVVEGRAPAWLDDQRLLDAFGGLGRGDPRACYAAFVADGAVPKSPPAGPRPPRAPGGSR